MCVCEIDGEEDSRVSSSVLSVSLSLSVQDNGKTQYDSCLLNYNIQCVAGNTEQGELGSLCYLT